MHAATVAADPSLTPCMAMCGVPWADMVQYISNMSCECSNVTKLSIIVRVRVVRVRVGVRIGG